MISKNHPDPGHVWKIGDPILSPVSQMISIDPVEVGPAQTYQLMVGAIVPRPIAFVSTLGLSGIGNLAPFSFYNGISSSPPTLMISITPKNDGGDKDTLINIRETREFVVNSVNAWIVGPAHLCSASYPYGTNEMEKVGLTPLKSERVKPPRVKESAVQMECELETFLQVGSGLGSASLVVGKIVMIHIFDKALQDGKILVDVLQPVARLGGPSYSEIGTIFNLPRPK